MADKEQFEKDAESMKKSHFLWKPKGYKKMYEETAQKVQPKAEPKDDPFPGVKTPFRVSDAGEDSGELGKKWNETFEA